MLVSLADCFAMRTQSPSHFVLGLFGFESLDGHKKKNITVLFLCGGVSGVHDATRRGFLRICGQELGIGFHFTLGMAFIQQPYFEENRQTPYEFRI